MDNKMKVINLILGKYHNKEMPKHIIINRLNYFYNENRKTYESEYGEQMSFDFTDNVLNMEVEVVEEQEEIDIQELEEIKEMEVFLSVDTRQTLEENLKKIDKHEVNFFFKINEIIRKQNKIVQYLEQLDKNIKEKQ